MTPVAIASTVNGRIPGAEPTARLVAALRKHGTVRAYRITRTSDVYDLHPDKWLGYSDALDVHLTYA